VIVVDNGSVDGSPEFISKNFPLIKLIRNDQNLGYSKANNQGIREAKGEFILFLNSDTRTFPGAFDLLLEEMKAFPSVGAVGPALISEKDRYQVSFGMKINFVYEMLQKCLLNHYFRQKLKGMQQKLEVGWLSGACLLTRKSVLEEVGLFDEKFFLYFEDIDLCRKISSNGRKLIFVPKAKVFHAEGVSTGLYKLSSLFYYRQSQIYFYRKHCSETSTFLLRVYLRINFILLFITDFMRSRKDRDLLLSFFRLLR